MVNILNSLGLHLDKLVGVATDTCNVMASSEKGAVAEIKRSAPFAIHSPCLNHLVNLSVKLICSRPDIDLHMKTVQDLYNFFSHPKRNELLQTFAKNSSKKQLAKTVLTRWTSAATATSTLIILMKPVKQALIQAATWSNTNVKRESLDLINRINADFIISLLLIDKLLHTVMPLVKMLQKKNLVISDAHQLVDATIANLEKLYSKNGIFDNLYSKPEDICL